MKVVVALDDSPYSDAAGDVALDLAAHQPGVEIRAVHVVNVVAPSGSLLRDLPGRIGFEPAVVAADVAAEHDGHGARVLARFADRAREKGVAVTTLLDHGGVHERLLHHAERADLLILGDHGETETRFPGQGGSHLRELADACTVALLAVPRECPPLRSVVLGYDGSVGGQHALKAVAAAYPHWLHTVHLVYVGSGDGAILEEAAADLRGGQIVRHVAPEGNVAHTLLDIARKCDAGLVALGFHGRPSVRRFLVGSSCDALLGAAEVALLVVH